jgi:hypothetical protein
MGILIWDCIQSSPIYFVKEVSKAGLDGAKLGSMLCDLTTPSCKSKSQKFKDKNVEKCEGYSNSSRIHHERHAWNSRGLHNFAKRRLLFTRKKRQLLIVYMTMAWTLLR